MASTEAPTDLEDSTCGSLLRKLQHTWDEIGESDEDRDKILLEIEQECLLVYRRKVDSASLNRARLLKTIADSKAEIATLSSLLGDRSSYSQVDTTDGTLKEQLNSITPQLGALRKKKEDRVEMLMDVKREIQELSQQLFGFVQCDDSEMSVTEQDLYPKQLEEYRSHLQALLEEKSDRVQMILEYGKELHNLCSVLGMDFCKTASNVHPSLLESESSPKCISNDILERLIHTIRSLKEEKKERMQKLRDIGASLRELWSLMDTPDEEQQLFQNVTCMLETNDSQVSAPASLALDIIEEAEVELERLSHHKTSKLKELVLKKRLELEEICRNAHMEVNSTTLQDKMDDLIDSVEGMIDASELLTSLEEQIAKAKDEALSRKDVLDKIEKWLAACEEEIWLEDYSRDENRYNAGRGAHVNLKRAEKARSMVQKLPALVEAITEKTKSWEEEKCTLFLYDGVRLLSMLDEYNLLRQEKDEEKRRLRDQKRLQEQLINEKETLYGSRPSPHKATNVKRNQGVLRVSHGGSPGNRRLSVGGPMLHPRTPDVLVPRVNGVTPSRLGTSGGKDSRKDKSRPSAPVNYVALSKEESGSYFTACRPDENILQLV